MGMSFWDFLALFYFTLLLWSTFVSGTQPGAVQAKPKPRRKAPPPPDLSRVIEQDLDQECCICFEHMTQGQTVIGLPCQHNFHAGMVTHKF